MREFTLKIGSETNPVKAANSIATQILLGNTVYADAIGVNANYAASKSFIQARKILLKSGISVAYQPTFKEVTVMKDTKTAINWEVIIL